MAAGTGSMQMPAAEAVIWTVISWGVSHWMSTSAGSTPLRSSR